MWDWGEPPQPPDMHSFRHVGYFSITTLQKSSIISNTIVTEPCQVPAAAAELATVELCPAAAAAMAAELHHQCSLSSRPSTPILKNTQCKLIFKKAY